jgi:hypothetical protein
MKATTFSVSRRFHDALIADVVPANAQERFDAELLVLLLTSDVLLILPVELHLGTTRFTSWNQLLAAFLSRMHVRCRVCSRCALFFPSTMARPLSGKREEAARELLRKQPKMTVHRTVGT